MKRILTLPVGILIPVVAFFAACESPQQTTVVQQQKKGGFMPPRHVSDTDNTDSRPSRPSTADTPHMDADIKPDAHGDGGGEAGPAAAPKTGSFEYGKSVPNKPGFVTSPYAPEKGYVDVRGFPPGTEVKDPYTGKTFLVP